MTGCRRFLIGAMVAAAALTGGCAQEEPALTVLAAASLHEPFDELSARYTAETGVAVELRSAGSPSLVDQLEHGAAGDVLATADQASMDRAEKAGLLAEQPQIFAHNHMVIVTPAENPAHIQGLADLRAGATVSVCALQVPCGAAAARVLESAGITLSPLSEELSVTDVLGRVRAGEADAGLVYTTTARQAGEAVHVIPLEGADAEPNHYPAAVLDAAQLPDEAQAFVDYLFSAEAQQLLAEAGFSRAENQ